jgi:hypothetical protein
MHLRFLRLLWLKIIWAYWDSWVYSKYYEWRQGEYLDFMHDTILVRERGCHIDVHVLPICQKLWDAGIETFYSCQGGPSGMNVKSKKIYVNRAYVAVLDRDAKKVADILSDLHPKIEPGKPGAHPHLRAAVRFDPSPEAMSWWPEDVEKSTRKRSVT